MNVAAGTIRTRCGASDTGDNTGWNIPKMQIVTTHTHTDFDALASLVAASFLYPDAVRVMPAQVQPAVREFLAVHWDLLRLKPRRAIDPASVTRLIVTDTGGWERLDDLSMLATRTDLETIVWDHHMAPGSIAATELHREEVGAAVTLLLERMQALECALSPIHATLFLLGIYDDTGALSYPSTTARDARMTAYLLESGADLNVVAAYLDSSLDERHLDVFNRMLIAADTCESDGVRIGICLAEADKSLNNLARVVSKVLEIKELDVVFGIFPLAESKTLAIGRGNPQLFDIGATMRRLGGGGHPGAGSSVIKRPADAVRAQLDTLIEQAAFAQISVRDLMSPVTDAVSPKDCLREASERLRQLGRTALLVIDEQGRALGTLSEDQCAQIRDDAAWSHPVTALMRNNPLAIEPDRSLREALRLMSQAEVGLLPVLDAGRVIGEITRAAIILNLYDF